MVRLGMGKHPVPTRVYDPWGCPQATAPLTVPTPLSNITLDTGPPPFNWLPLYGKGATDRGGVNQIVRSVRNKLRTMRRKGTRASMARLILTIQSAVANETHSAVTGP